MKLLVKEYLNSLRERDELDAVLPDLLSELGHRVISRPVTGVRQYGVDVASGGSDEKGRRSLHLFSIKSGDLTRSEWYGGPQTLRPSLDEIVEVYLRTHVPRQYADLPVVIVLCFGGDVRQGVEDLVNGYIEAMASRRPDLTYEIWDGDRLAEMILTGVLGPELMPKHTQSLFRKSIALLDEPDAAVGYHLQFVRALIEGTGTRQKDKIRTARQLNLCLWILFVWGRDVGNLEAPYRIAEISVLHLWPLAAELIGGRTKEARAMELATHEILRLHLVISTQYAYEKILPHVSALHGLSCAVRASNPIDVTRSLFDVIGRLGLLGLCHAVLQANVSGVSSTVEEGREAPPDVAGDIANAIIALVNNNPVLLLPLEDHHSTDVGLACLFLHSRGRSDAIRAWTGEIVRACALATLYGGRYPCCLSDYEELLEHPGSEDGYRERVTAASTLYPTLAFWAERSGGRVTLGELYRLIDELYPHTALQLWAPGPDSEAHWYVGGVPHGRSLGNLSIDPSGRTLVDVLAAEAKHGTDFAELSVVRHDMGIVLLIACRHHRQPLPPQLLPLG